MRAYKLYTGPYEDHPIDLELLKHNLYFLRRSWMDDLKGRNRIDAICGDEVYARVTGQIIRYFKEKYGTVVEHANLPMEPLVISGVKIADYALFNFPDEGATLALIRHREFGQRFPRVLALIDWQGESEFNAEEFFICNSVTA